MWKCCDPFLPFRNVREVDGTLWQVPRCDVTAMASVGWLEARVLVILLLCLVLLLEFIMIPYYIDSVDNDTIFDDQNR